MPFARRIASFVLCVLLCAWTHGSAIQIGLSELPVGAGGEVTGIDIECDQGVGACSSGVGSSTIVTRTDSYGGWYYNPTIGNCGNAKRTGCFQQIVTPTAMPSDALVYGGGNQSGVYEIAIAPSNTSHWYLYWAGTGCIYSSTNKGVTFTKTGFSCITVSANTGAKQVAPHMAVDPANENIVYADTPAAGLYVTSNAGLSWSLISTATVPVGGGSSSYGGQAGGNAIAFDPTSGTANSNCGSQTSCTQGIYECSTGTGVYHTTNGGNTGGNYPTISGIMFDPAMFMYSTNGGTTWSAVPNVLEVSCFGFGAAAPGQSYPAIYIVGQVNSVYGIWQSINDAQSWTLIGTYPNDSLDSITAISGDPNVYGQVYVGFRGSGYAVLVAPS